MSMRRIVFGGTATLLAVATTFAGQDSANAKIVGIGAFALFVAVTTLGPVLARPVAATLGRPIAKVRGTSGAIARENAMRNPKRTARTASSLMIGVALVSFLAIFASSIKTSGAGTFRDDFRGNVIVDSGAIDDSSGLTPSLATDLATQPGVHTVTEQRIAAVETNGAPGLLNAYDTSTVATMFDLGAHRRRPRATRHRRHRRLGPDWTRRRPARRQPDGHVPDRNSDLHGQSHLRPRLGHRRDELRRSRRIRPAPTRDARLTDLRRRRRHDRRGECHHGLPDSEGAHHRERSSRSRTAALSGALIAIVGVGICFVVNAATYVVVIIALIGLRTSELVDRPLIGPTKGKLREGLAYVRNQRDVRRPLLVMAIVGTVALNFQTTFPSMVRFGFDRGAGSIGTAMSVSAIGSILGGIYIAGVTPHPAARSQSR